MKDLTFGQYYPSDSVVHRMDARVKILLMILYIAAIFFISSYFGYAVTLVFACFESADHEDSEIGEAYYGDTCNHRAAQPVFREDGQSHRALVDIHNYRLRT